VPALQAAGATPQPYLAAGTAVYTQIVGDGDNVIEPNETWSISLPLTNVGAASAASINSTLSSATAGVTILSANATYPNLAPSASANNATAYQFRVETAFPCGSPINFSQNLTYVGANSPQTVGFASGTGGLGSPSTFTYADAPVAIPDEGAAINVPLAVSGISGAVGDVNLKIEGSSCSAAAGSTTVGIDHTYVADLAISLVSPDGTVVPVISNAGGSGNNFCQTVLDDQSAGPSIQTVAAAQAPFTGSFKPSGPLSNFAGHTANGTWQLRAQDSGPADTGSVRAFSLSVTPVVCNAPPVGGTPTVSINDVSVTEGNSGTVNATFTATLSASSTASATVRYATAAGTATEGVDYVRRSGTITFSPGQTSRTVSIVVNGDTTFEPDETFLVNLSTPVGLTIGDGQGVGTIVNDDASPNAAGISTNVSSFNFGNVAVGATSPDRGLIITSSGTAPLAITSIRLTGSEFTGASNCPSSLAPGASCTLTGRFKPTAAGLRQGSVTITTNAPTSPTVVPLSGTGV